MTFWQIDFFNSVTLLIPLPNKHVGKFSPRRKLFMHVRLTTWLCGHLETTLQMCGSVRVISWSMELIGITVSASILLAGLGGLGIYACSKWKSSFSGHIGKTMDHMDQIPATHSNTYDSIQVIRVTAQKWTGWHFHAHLLWIAGGLALKAWECFLQTSFLLSRLDFPEKRPPTLYPQLMRKESRNWLTELQSPQFVFRHLPDHRQDDRGWPSFVPWFPSFDSNKCPVFSLERKVRF